MSTAGKWRIVEMDVWDLGAIELLGPGYIELNQHGTGRFRFIAVDGRMDCRNTIRDGRRAIEFTWEGNDECDPVLTSAQPRPQGRLFASGDSPLSESVDEALVRFDEG